MSLSPLLCCPCGVCWMSIGPTLKRPPARRRLPCQPLLTHCTLAVLSFTSRYRLSVPAAKYAPWFGVVLKGARLAVKVLQLLSLEARASKLRCGGKLSEIDLVVCFVAGGCARARAACGLASGGQLHVSNWLPSPLLPTSVQLQRHCEAPGGRRGERAHLHLQEGESTCP